MLTIDEEKARGKELSTLYPTPKSAKELAPRVEHAKKTDWGVVAKQGILLGVVTAIAFVLIAVFMRLSFTSTGQLQQWSILFIVFALLAALIFISGARTAQRTLAIVVIYGSGMFWSGVITALGSSVGLYALLFGNSRPELTEFWIKLTAASITIVIVTTVVMLIVGALLEKSKPNY